jgi:hypothetical protein
MVSANEFEIEGLVGTASGTPGELKQATTLPQPPPAHPTAPSPHEQPPEPPHLPMTGAYHPRSMLRRCQRNSNMLPSCGWSQEIFMVETGPMFSRSISPQA